ncbi:DNA mismatch repair endonuclease MutL [Ruminococcaceae bacterium OttesenSCG-928-D13]|nr:DNA mismatch repair endonuclease MutL [Ruminococcaceae bacterium OttesenSCG-928-D13]
MAINVLDKHTAELIAAGEVVERPSSVAKELIENAIDAGAGSVTVEIEGGGIALLRVSDNGGGIEREDIPLAFVRHATSKVKTEKDLDAIATLGFRGEALASIGSVAAVRVLTKSPADADAWEYTMRGGEAGELLEAARPQGTTIEVRDLFYNTPARMKFLKKDASEGGFVTEVVTRLALSHTEVAFTYLREGKQVFATSGDGDLRAAAWQVLGKEFARELAPVAAVSGLYAVDGLITPPRLGRASRATQFFFINGRYVKNRTMMAALEQAYRGMAMHGRFPGGLLFLTMPPALVDVNVHPAKTEVRFANEQEVFGAVYRAVKGALMETMKSHGQLELSEPTGEGSPLAGRAAPPAPAAAGGFNAPRRETPPQRQHSWTAPEPAPQATQLRAAGEMLKTTAAMSETLASEPGYIPYRTSGTAVPGGLAVPDGFAVPEVPTIVAPVAPRSEAGLDIFPEAEADPVPDAVPPPASAEIPQAVTEAKEEPAALRLIGEVFKTYILAETGEVLCLIDKHAAHERLLYEKIAASRGKVGSQLLLEPAAVTLSAAEKSALMENLDTLRDAGIDLEDFGDNTVLVRGVPADVEHRDIPGLVGEVAGRLAVNSKDSVDHKTEWVMHSIACRAAVKAGDKTSPEALLALTRDILDGSVPPFCPHGRPVVLEITRKELEKQFGRLG